MQRPGLGAALPVPYAAEQGSAILSAPVRHCCPAKEGGCLTSAQVSNSRDPQLPKDTSARLELKTGHCLTITMMF